MLSSRERLDARQGQHAPARHEYLQHLVDEYQRSVHALRKEEIVANLANFAYDPINFASLAQLQIMDLFLDILDADHAATTAADTSAGAHATLTQKSTSSNTHINTSVLVTAPTREQQQLALLASFATGGICNCIADPVLQQQFVDGDGWSLVEPYVWSIEDAAELLTGARNAARLNTLLSALAIAFFLLDSSAFVSVTHERLRRHIQSLELHTNAQIANIAAAFCTRYEELVTVNAAFVRPSPVSVLTQLTP